MNGFKICRRPPNDRQDPTNNPKQYVYVQEVWMEVTSWNEHCKHLYLLYPRHSRLQLDSAIEEWIITTETTAIQQHPPQHHPAATTMAHYKPTQPEKTPAVSPHSPKNSVYPVNDYHVLKYDYECRSMHWRI